MKILADQFFAAPFFAITFIFGMGLLEDKRISECWREFIMKFPAIYLVSLFVFLSINKAHEIYIILQCYKIAYYSMYIFCVFQFDWIIWPPTQYINFKYIPQSARVLYVNIITVLWDIFLSYIKHIDEVSKYL